VRVALACFVVLLVAAGTAGAQQPLGPGLSVGLGGGVAGPTGGSGTSSTNTVAGPVITGSVDLPLAPLVMIGAQADYWRRTSVNALFATAVLTLHVAGTPLSIKAGGGFGRGDFGAGALSGPAGQLGLVYQFPGGRPAPRLFANAFLASGSPRNVLLIDAGLALAWR
jgi:hypothetical protein